MIKKLSLIFLILAAFALTAFAQTEERNETSETLNAVKIDKFGNVSYEYFRMKLEQFYVVLNNNPNATGYFINFGSAREIARVEKLIRNQIRIKKFDAQRLVIVNGGKAEELQTQFWLVPLGAKPPTPEYNKELK